MVNTSKRESSKVQPPAPEKEGEGAAPPTTPTPEAMVYGRPGDEVDAAGLPSIPASALIDRVLRSIEDRLSAPFDMGKAKILPGKKNRDGAAIHYAPWTESVLTLNRLFGGLGWGDRIDASQVHVVEHVNKQTGEITGWDAWATVDVTLWIGQVGMIVQQKSGSGVGLGENARHPGQAIDTAKKAAASDALKRAALKLGNVFGIALYYSGEERDELSEGAAPVDPADRARAAASERARARAAAADAPQPGAPQDAPAAPGGAGPSQAASDAPGGAAAPQAAPPRAAALPTYPDALRQRVAGARLFMSGEIEAALTEHLRSGGGPDSPLVPSDPTDGDLDLAGWRSTKPSAADLCSVPANEAVPPPMLNDLHQEAVVLAGGNAGAVRRIGNLWSQCGVKLGRGAVVRGYQARLFAVCAASNSKGEVK